MERGLTSVTRLRHTMLRRRRYQRYLIPSIEKDTNVMFNPVQALANLFVYKEQSNLLFLISYVLSNFSLNVVTGRV